MKIDRDKGQEKDRERDKGRQRERRREGNKGREKDREKEKEIKVERRRERERGGREREKGSNRQKTGEGELCCRHTLDGREEERKKDSTTLLNTNCSDFDREPQTWTCLVFSFPFLIET